MKAILLLFVTAVMFYVSAGTFLFTPHHSARRSDWLAERCTTDAALHLVSLCTRFRKSIRNREAHLPMLQVVQSRTY